jgi:pectinesterase
MNSSAEKSYVCTDSCTSFKQFYKMKNGITPFLLLIFLHTLNAQSTKGITGKRDTGYTTFKAHKDIRKSHPNVAIAEILDKPTPSVSEQRNVTFASIGDRNLQLDAFFPKKKRKKPRTAILIIHGGGWRTGNRAQHIPLAQHLATLGYVCFTPEYRLSTEALFPAAVHDLKAAIRWMRANAKTYNIDTNRIATLGFSAGGQLSALLSNTGDNPTLEGTVGTLGHSSKINAIVDIDGILAFIHPESGEGDDTRNTSAATYWFGFTKTENPDLWRQGSALTYISEKTPPTLFINSGVDRMHAGRTDYINKLTSYNIYSEIRTFADSPHSFCLFEPWFTPTVKYIDAFLKKILSR